MATDREIQQAATPGPWRHHVIGHPIGHRPGVGWFEILGVTDEGTPRIVFADDSAFVAHFNPQRVGLLPNVLDAARACHENVRIRVSMEHAVLLRALDAYDALGSSPDTHERPAIDFLDLDIDQEDFNEDAGNEHGPGFLTDDTADVYRWILVPSGTTEVLRHISDRFLADVEVDAARDIVARWDAATEEIEL